MVFSISEAGILKSHWAHWFYSSFVTNQFYSSFVKLPMFLGYTPHKLLMSSIG